MGLDSPSGDEANDTVGATGDDHGARRGSTSLGKVDDVEHPVAECERAEGSGQDPRA